jgi:hypothetical protein
MDYGFRSAFLPLAVRRKLRSEALAKAVEIFKEEDLVLGPQVKRYFEGEVRKWPKPLDLPPGWEDVV